MKNIEKSNKSKQILSYAQAYIATQGKNNNKHRSNSFSITYLSAKIL